MAQSVDPKIVGGHYEHLGGDESRTRVNFAKTKQVQDVPNLINIQLESYKWFVEEGMYSVLKDSSNIVDHTGTIILDYLDFSIDKTPKYSIKECKERDTTYAAPLRVTCRLTNKTTDEIQEQNIFFGDFPLMTDTGHQMLQHQGHRLLLPPIITG